MTNHIEFMEAMAFFVIVLLVLEVAATNFSTKRLES